MELPQPTKGEHEGPSRVSDPYIASPDLSSRSRDATQPLPDESWAVDERSLKLFVDALQQPPAERAWYELRREAERIALVPGSTG